MIMFRIPIAQPPKATRKSAENGRIQWCRKLRANSSDHAGCSASPYAPETGKIASVEANNQASMIPSHICGVAVST